MNQLVGCPSRSRSLLRRVFSSGQPPPPGRWVRTKKRKGVVLSVWESHPDSLSITTRPRSPQPRGVIVTDGK